MKIAFIGGGSVQWAPKIITDIATCETLAGASLVLHDVDLDALDLLARAGQRIVAEVHGTRVTSRDGLEVTAEPDRAAALRDADFVIFCVGIGGLAAMRNDLDIPERYGIYQPVGDTVGPGGLARGLRHIPFAVQVAREMEQLCPAAWLLNITNPMTTICRGVTRATSIRTIGLCHEVTGVTRHLASLFGVSPEAITAEVAGINHFPAILRLDVAGENGLDMLRAWLAEHGPFACVGDMDLHSAFDVFVDRLAVKLTLFQQLGVLFGAGDRHLTEFVPQFLHGPDRGRRYGVVMTTIAHREEMARLRRAQIESFVAGEPAEVQRSTEQLAPVMAALAGGPAGRFIVNVPNEGQIDNLPRQAVVECIADVSAMGVRPLAVGALPLAAQAVIAPHVARQELIVEAALAGRRQSRIFLARALAALATDPQVHDPATVEPMLKALLEANMGSGTA